MVKKKDITVWQHDPKGIFGGGSEQISCRKVHFETGWKEPAGAVAQGQSMQFQLAFTRECGAYQVRLVLFADDGSGMIAVPMFFCGLDHNWEYYVCEAALAKTGLYWYRFEYDSPEGLVKVGCGQDGLAQENQDASWQLTVFAEDYTTPEWLKGGILYQIFPDRFYRSRTYVPKIREDSYLREDWGGEPRLERHADGSIPNNDFFGGNLRGIQEKLDYLFSLGVTCLYLNPIFEAASNHKYDTGDYEEIDGVFGTREDFVRLCEKAKEKGIRILLDGVFNHTGSDSKYFNQQGRYESLGAFQSKASPYYQWYHFTDWPCEYNAWWGIKILPQVNEDNPDYLEYITGEEGIVRKWIGLGASGYRLDVADELPDLFLDRLRNAVKSQDPQAVIIGEVWEDASNKISYGKRRRYLQGRQLDSVMNYVFKDAILAFALGGTASDLAQTVEAIVEHYPKASVDCLMNILGTHDTRRVLTVLSDEGRDGRQLLKNAAILQYFLPGVPCIFYGDEAGLTGEGDPFCRGCFPWDHMDKELVSFYRKLGKIRISHRDILAEGIYRTIYEKDFVYGFSRRSGRGELKVYVNMGQDEVYIPAEKSVWKDRQMMQNPERRKDLLTGRFVGDLICIRAMSSVILAEK